MFIKYGHSEFMDLKQTTNTPKPGIGSQIIRVKQFRMVITAREANYQQKQLIQMLQNITFPVD